MLAVERIIPAHVPKRAPGKRATGSSRPPTRVEDGGRLPARNDEPVQPVELRRQLTLDRVRAERTQHRQVLAGIALQRQDADARRIAHPS